MSDRPWGVIEAGRFRALPRLPLEHGGYRPPCDVVHPTGVVLHVIEEPVLVCDWEVGCG